MTIGRRLRSHATEPAARPTEDRDSAMPVWVRPTLALGAVLTVLAGVLSFVSPGELPALDLGYSAPVTPAVLIYATYNGSRNLVLGMALALLLGSRTRWARPGLTVLVAIIAATHGLDAAAQLAAQRWAAAPGSAVLAIVFGCAAASLDRHRPTEMR